MLCAMRKYIFVCISLFVLIGGAKGSGQTVSELAVSDLDRLSKQRAVVEQHLSTEVLESNYLKAAGKLGALRAILDAGIYSSTQTYELQSLGIVLGDAFVDEMEFRWVMVEDQYGRDPALKYRDSSIIIFPLTMISKRVEKGEQVDVFALFNDTAAEVEDLLRQDN